MIAYNELVFTEQDAVNTLFCNYDAICPYTGILLRFSGGRSRGAPRFFVIAPDHEISHYLDYKAWRYSSRAWSLDEAIEKALNNKKVRAWRDMIYRREYNRMICD